MVGLETFSKTLHERMKILGMTYQALARRSGVSMPTVRRILAGVNPGASYANVRAIVEALGMESDPEEFRERQALEKARRLVGMVQGTSGLEGQAVDDGTMRRMVNQTVHELLAGSGRKLWDE